MHGGPSDGATADVMMPTYQLPDYHRVRRVHSFDELASATFTDGVNALCWERTLTGDFAEVAARCGAEDDITTLDEARLLELALSPQGQAAVAGMLDDFRRLRALDLDPVLNCIQRYPRDEEAGPVATDVYSFHADSAPVTADTWLCTYHGAPSEGVRNEDAQRRVDLPATRAALLRDFGGEDDAAFREYLRDHCYDLHYAALPHARPFSFGVRNLWRIAIDTPGSPVPPCIHRAPLTQPGDPARLLLIS